VLTICGITSSATAAAAAAEFGLPATASAELLATAAVRFVELVALALHASVANRVHSYERPDEYDDDRDVIHRPFQ